MNFVIIEQICDPFKHGMEKGSCLVMIMTTRLLDFMRLYSSSA
jgi:hypothetical protein